MFCSVSKRNVFQDPSFCGIFCTLILNNPMFYGVFGATPLQNPMQQFSNPPPPCFCSCFNATMFVIPAFCCAFSAMILKFAQCNLSSAKRLSKTPTEDFPAVRSAPDAVPRTYARPRGVQFALGLLHLQAMPTPTAAELAQVFGAKPMVSQDQLLLCFKRPR